MSRADVEPTLSFQQDILKELSMSDYFFYGNQYIRVSRGDIGPGSLDQGYPGPITNWGWKGFGADGIDAALYSGSKCYFFKGAQYIRVSRGITGPGTLDPGYPASITNWNWGAFGADGIDAALWSGPVCYFFKGDQYIRVSRGDTGPGSVDPGYPQPISNWNWGQFGATGIDGALNSGDKCYFFKQGQYVRVSRGAFGPGLLDHNYPAPLSNWTWGSFSLPQSSVPLGSFGPLEPDPTDTGLVSNHNFFMENGGANLTGVSVTLYFDEDFLSSNGWGVQVNAYSPKGYATAQQQYVVFVGSGSSQYVAHVDNFINSSNELIQLNFDLAAPSGGKMPAGSSLTITLTNDASDNITGAIYTMTDKNGNQIGNKPVTIVGQTLDSHQVATTANLAPIVAFQVNIVGCYEGAVASLKEGSGTMVCSANSALTVTNSAPTYVSQAYYTLETANIAYGPVPTGPNGQVCQFFWTSEMSTATAEKARAYDAAHLDLGKRLPAPAK
jgi:hypothetical protein